MKKLGEEGLQKERVEKDKAMFGGREIAGKTLAIIGMGHIGAATAREASALGMETVGTSFCVLICLLLRGMLRLIISQ
jgi:D-3-phosphoglycerate dehydrogenase